MCGEEFRFSYWGPIFMFITCRLYQYLLDTDSLLGMGIDQILRRKKGSALSVLISRLCTASLFASKISRYSLILSYMLGINPCLPCLRNCVSLFHMLPNSLELVHSYLPCAIINSYIDQEELYSIFMIHYFRY